MIIAITGASGFIAKSLKKSPLFYNIHFVSLNRSQSEEHWKELLKNSQVVINLAGAPVIKRWTQKNKTQILNSRIETTRKLVSVLNQLPQTESPELFISASAIGIYPDKGTELLDEHSTQRGDSFLSEVVEQWENEARMLTSPFIRLVITRIGIVLGKEGGLLKKTLPLFKVGLGGKIGQGHQAFSFIHVNDVAKAIRFFIENKKTTGVYNLVAPNNINNTQFTKTLAKSLHRPAFIPVPAFALNILYGEASRIMVNGEKVYPARLINAGFQFDYPTIEKAISEIVDN